MAGSNRIRKSIIIYYENLLWKLCKTQVLHDTPLYCEFAHLDPGATWLTDESTILRFGKTPSPRHLLEEHNLSIQLLAIINATLATKGMMLKTGTVVAAPLIAAPTSTKNDSGERDPEMHQTKKGNRWHFGVKAHIGVDADSGLVHSVIGTAANVHNVTQGNALLHGDESVVFADAALELANGKTRVSARLCKSNAT